MKNILISSMFIIAMSASVSSMTVKDDYHVNNNKGDNSYTVMDDNYKAPTNLNQNSNHNVNRTNSTNTSANDNNSSANGTGGSNGGNSVNIKNERSAPPAVAPNVTGVAGTNSVSGGVSTIFGGISFGKSTTIREARILIKAQAQQIDIDNVIKIDASDLPLSIKKMMINKILRKYSR